MLTDYSKENLPLFVFLIFCIIYSFVSSSIIAFHKIQTLSRKIQVWFVLNFILLISAIIMIIKFGLGSNLSILLFSLWFGLTLSIYFWYMNSDNKILKMKARLALSNVCIVILCFIVLCIVFLYQDAKLVQINNEKNRIIRNKKLDKALHLASTCSTTYSYEDIDKSKIDPFVCFQPIIALSLRDSLITKDDNENFVVIEYNPENDEQKNHIEYDFNNMIENFIFSPKIVFQPDPSGNLQKIQNIRDKSLKILNHKHGGNKDLSMDDLNVVLLGYSGLIAKDVLSKAKTADDFGKFLTDLDNCNYNYSDIQNLFFSEPN